MAGDKIRIGLIGANANYGWSQRAHLPALLGLPEYELTAVCTSRKETAEESAKHYGVPLAFHDYREMAAHPDVECLLFPTGRGQDVYSLLEKLRDLFAKDRISPNSFRSFFHDWPASSLTYT